MEYSTMAKYRKLSITLTESERHDLEEMTKKGMSGAMEIRRANVLLMADESCGRKRQKDVDIAKALGITPQAVHDIKSRYIERSGGPGGGVGAVARKRRETPPVPAKFTGDIEARITSIACSEPPEGMARWNLRLIAERAVELEIVDSISHTQVGRILKKTGISLT